MLLFWLVRISKFSSSVPLSFSSRHFTKSNLGDFTAEVRKLNQTERHLYSSYSVAPQITPTVCRGYAHRTLFLVDTNFEHKEKHCPTWQHPQSTHRWIQIAIIREARYKAHIFVFVLLNVENRGKITPYSSVSLWKS